jgi:hypothetical protein
MTASGPRAGHHDHDHDHDHDPGHEEHGTDQET